MLDFNDIEIDDMSNRMAGDGCFKCGECRYFERDFRPQYGKPCIQRKVKENQNAPICFVPDVAKLSRVPSFCFEQISMLVTNLTSTQRRTFGQLMLNSPKCVSYAFFEKVWFHIGDPRFLKAWRHGYVLHAPKINLDRDHVEPMSARNGTVPRPTEITLIFPSESGGMSFATMLHYSIKSKEEFQPIYARLVASALVEGPRKPGKLRGEDILRQRDEAAEKEAARKAKEQRADSDDLDQDMWSTTSEFIPSGTDDAVKIGRGQNQMTISRTTGKRNNVRKVPTNRDPNGDIYV